MLKSLTPIIVTVIQVDINGDIFKWSIKDKWVEIFGGFDAIPWLLNAFAIQFDGWGSFVRWTHS